ncbi:MAG: lysine--tRNA ligase [Candidatus Micrarchaeota archaeon]|nr:lysine--tRNA ligase [Candidatus Micrarchaeota archaeon]
MQERNKEELKDKHWSEILVDRLMAEKKAPYVLTGGISTSGPAHLGTICEFLYSGTLLEVLQKRGVDAKFYFIGDILDNFDGVPAELKDREGEFTQYLGMPLSKVPDPFKCHGSYGEHYLAQAEEAIKILGTKANVVKVNELYESGGFDPYTRIYLKNEAKVKEVVARTSLRKVEDMKDWSPIMPICEKCGKVITTRVTWHDEEEYEYVCDKNANKAQSCGFKGRDRISSHHYKLQWRLHWPTWQAYYNSSIEGSGVDHMTRGGSADTAIAIHKEILNREPPILYRFGWFFLQGGKKFSKSAGTGIGALEILKLVPPEIVKYELIVPNVQQNKMLDPTGENMIKVYGDIERISKLPASDNRADQKKLLAMGLAGKPHWKAPFLDMLLNYQIYRDWGRVGDLLSDREGVAYLAPFITEWLSQGFEPEQYNFSIRPQKISEHKELVGKFAEALKPGMNDLDVHNLVYDVTGDDKEQAGALFASVYKAIIGKDKGPRLGKLIAAIGVEKAKAMLASAVK